MINRMIIDCEWFLFKLWKIVEKILVYCVDWSFFLEIVYVYIVFDIIFRLIYIRILCRWI